MGLLKGICAYVCIYIYLCLYICVSVLPGIGRWGPGEGVGVHWKGGVQRVKSPGGRFAGSVGWGVVGDGGEGVLK